MSEKKNLLVELLVEELPPKALQKLGEAFGSRVAEELVSTRSVEPEDADRRKVFASPRRLAVFIPGVYSTTAQTQETTRLMPKKVAFAADGITATPALHKKLRPYGYPDGTIPHADLLVKAEGGAE
ncbi:MAG TPA: glycine--tRNA ligase subunit beta, partial [Burkholderiaceae bacterium]|nr:glycine--tRNA ligase subunit beta [Burkholderiaceae bacterium]